MKKVLAILVMIAMAGVAGAELVDVFYNGDLELHQDDGYGREMPLGWGLWAEYDGWDGIPNVATTTLEAQSGLAAFDMDLTTAWGAVAFIQNKQALGADVQIGSYTMSAYVKGTIVGGVIGADIFAPDYAGYWGNTFTDISGTYADWTLVSHTFDVANGDAWFNTLVKAGTGSDFLVDSLSLTTDVVPEPATAGLMAIFGGAIMLFRRYFGRG